MFIENRWLGTMWGMLLLLIIICYKKKPINLGPPDTWLHSYIPEPSILQNQQTIFLSGTNLVVINQVSELCQKYISTKHLNSDENHIRIRPFNYQVNNNHFILFLCQSSIYKTIMDSWLSLAEEVSLL